MKKLLRWLSIPWWALLLPKRKGFHPYFGPSTLAYGGPDLKIHKLKRRFGNSLWPSCIYVLSGKPLPTFFLKVMRARGVRILLNQDGVFYPAWFSGNVSVQNSRLRDLHSSATQVIYQSQFCIDTCRIWVQPPEKPSILLYNGVDTDQFQPSTSVPAKPLKLLACSYFNRSNGYVLEYLLKMAHYLEEMNIDCELVIAGRMAPDIANHFSERLDSDEKGPQKHCRLRYLGPYSQDQAAAIYVSAHILLHFKYMDPCPSTVLEAMACGLPVLYSRSGGTPELVGEAGIGLDVETSYDKIQTPSLAAIPNALAQIDERWLRLSKEARRRSVELFSLTQWTERHKELLQIRL